MRRGMKYWLDIQPECGESRVDQADQKSTADVKSACDQFVLF